jgi:hypothetical protein
MKRVALSAAVAAVVLWGAKAVAIGVAGGLDRSPFEGPLFALGLLAILVACAATGAAATAGRALWIRILAAALALIIGLAVAILSDTASGALVPETAGWVSEEAGLWVSGLITLALVLFVTRRIPESTE